jgi:hypothetical protein
MGGGAEVHVVITPPCPSQWLDSLLPTLYAYQACGNQHYQAAFGDLGPVGGRPGPLTAAGQALGSGTLQTS